MVVLPGAFLEWHHLIPRLRTNRRLHSRSKPTRWTPDKNDLCDHLHDKQARLDQAIAEHRKAADRFYAKTIPSVLQISVPTGPLALAAALHAPPLTLAVLGTGAVALLALGWWAKFKDAERTMEAKPYQYLLTLERRFGSNA
jgi:hypothetical protein